MAQDTTCLSTAPRKFASSMSSRIEISEKWIKASIIGTIWAASEIVLGSFLHNLRIPFSSNVLTAIGIIILVSTSFKWTSKGVFWRAGLICALMKTMSPSAVIIGPMVAIFSQSLFLELFSRIFGRTYLGFTLGAIFAMSWNLFHKILNFIIYYGFNIVNVYSDLLKYAQKQLNIQVDLVWSPIIALALIYALLGFLSAVIGIRVGRQLSKHTSENLLSKAMEYKYSFNNRHPFDYSIIWLFVNITLIVGAFILLNFSTWPFWSASIFTIVIIWIIRYKRALRQLSRPRFWIFFALITMGTSFVVSKIQGESLAHGLLIGIQMNFRAAIVILGFSVLGTELSNPRVRDFFLKTSFRQLPLALELSFESLPMMIALVPEFKSMTRKPVSVLHQVISQVEYRLNEVRQRLAKPIFIIADTVGQGKTTQIHKLVETLKSRNIAVHGVYSPRVMDNGHTLGYDIVDIATGDRATFLRLESNNGWERFGKFCICPQGLELGVKTLAHAAQSDADVIVVDEVGRMELENLGWCEIMGKLVNNSTPLVMAIRDIFVDDIIGKWNLKNYSVFGVSDDLHREISTLITGRIDGSNTSA